MIVEVNPVRGAGGIASSSRGARVRVRKIFYLIFAPSLSAGPRQQITHINASIHIAAILFRQVSC